MADVSRDRLNRDYESLYRSYVALKREVEHLSTLREITLALNSSLDLNQTLTLIATVVQGALEVQRLTIYEIDADKDQALPIVARYGGDLITRERLAEDGIHLYGTRIHDSYRLRRTVIESSRLGHQLFIPLTTQKEVVGVALLERSADQDAFDREDEPLFLSLGQQIGMSVHNARLYALAVTDGLTGLFVRRYFDLRLQEEFNMGKRYRRAFSLLLFDIDHFKNFNDTHGHQTGDLVLQQFAQLIEASTRSTDICCRYGGEEFAVILPETHAGEAKTLAEKLRQRVSSFGFKGAGGEVLSVTTSIGLTTFRENVQTPSDMVKSADDALYEAKRGGRNRVVQAKNS